jgi:hypothetical protein
MKASRPFLPSGAGVPMAKCEPNLKMAANWICYHFIELNQSSTSLRAWSRA